MPKLQFEPKFTVYDAFAKSLPLELYSMDEVDRYFERLKQSATVVYGSPGAYKWSIIKDDSHTLLGYMFDVEEFKPKECEHEAIEYRNSLVANPCADPYEQIFKCKLCGVKLKAKWEACDP